MALGFSIESRAPRSVLLVEDNPGDVLLIRTALDEWTVPPGITLAADGAEALDLLRGNFHPDLVLLDLNLPKVDGHEVLRAMKGDPKLRLVPVVILSSSESRADILGAYADHCNAYVCKPDSLAEYRRLLGSLERFWFESAVLPGSHAEA